MSIEQIIILSWIACGFVMFHYVLDKVPHMRGDNLMLLVCVVFWPVVLASVALSHLRRLWRL